MQFWNWVTQNSCVWFVNLPFDSDLQGKANTSLSSTLSNFLSHPIYAAQYQIASRARTLPHKYFRTVLFKLIWKSHSYIKSKLRKYNKQQILSFNLISSDPKFCCDRSPKHQDCSKERRGWGDVGWSYEKKPQRFSKGDFRGHIWFQEI